MTNRQTFLSSFLRALGAEEIIWTDIAENYIAGTVIYERNNPEEVQDFKWTMTESESPDKKMQILIDYLFKTNLLTIDRLKKSPDNITIPGLTDQEKNLAFKRLFDVRVRMIDKGEETDYYFIHE